MKMSAHGTLIPGSLSTNGNVLFNGQATDTADYKGIAPSGGVSTVYVTAIVTMGNAADLVLTMYTADDADGTTPVALTQNIPIYENDTRQTDAKAHTITESTGSFVVVFCVPAIIIPADKYLCIHYANSNAANILTAIAFEDTYVNV
jgi:hypothetical protein